MECRCSRKTKFIKSQSMIFSLAFKFSVHAIASSLAIVVFCNIGPLWGPPREWGGGVSPCSVVPNKIVLVSPCSLKVFLRFWRFMFPKICFCSRVPSLIFLLFPCSEKVNGHVPLFPGTPGVPPVYKHESTARNDCWIAIRWLLVILRDRLNVFLYIY